MRPLAPTAPDRPTAPIPLASTAGSQPVRVLAPPSLVNRLAVPAGTLGISVITFCVCAIICIGTMAARRMAFGYELGTKMRWPTAVFFVGLWLTYVSVSTAIAYST